MLRTGDTLRPTFFRELPIDQTILIESAAFSEGVDPAAIFPFIAPHLVNGKLRTPEAYPAMTVSEDIVAMIETGNTAKITAVESKRVRFAIEGEGWSVIGSFRKGDLAY